MPFPRSDEQSLQTYLATSRPVDQLEPMLREFLNELFAGDRLEAGSRPSDSKGARTMVPEIIRLNKVRPSDKGGHHTELGADLDSRAAEAVRRLESTLPYLTNTLKTAGVRRVCFVPGENSGSFVFRVNNLYDNAVLKLKSSEAKVAAQDAFNKVLHQLDPLNVIELTDKEINNKPDFLKFMGKVEERLVSGYQNEDDALMSFLREVKKYIPDPEHPIKTYKGPKSVKSGRYSYVMAFGPVGDSDTDVALGQLLRISTIGEERHYDQSKPPPMLLKPIKKILNGPAHIEMFPEISTEGITERHIGFLDWISTATGNCFDDFHVNNAGLLKSGVPIVLDAGAISDHEHDLHILKELEKEFGRDFEKTNWGLYSMRQYAAGHTGAKHYPHLPIFSKQGVTLSDGDVIGISVNKSTLPNAGELPDDWRGWLQQLHLPEKKISSFHLESEITHYDFKKKKGHYTIPPELKKNFGQMVIFTQAINREIDELYQNHNSFPVPNSDWDAASLRKLEVYKDLRKALTTENYKVIAPLYEKAQEDHLKAHGMKYDIIKGAMSDDWLSKYRQRRTDAIMEAREIRKRVGKAVPADEDPIGDSKLAGLVERHNLDGSALGLALMAPEPIPGDTGDNWLERVEQSLSSNPTKAMPKRTG